MTAESVAPGEANVRVVNLHGWPGRETRPTTTGKRRPWAERLSQHAGLVLVAAADRSVTPERWGLGVALRFIGNSLTGAYLVVEDQAAARDQPLRRWARRHHIDTPAGQQPVEIITRRQLCDPDDGVLTTTAYGGGWWITADEGRTVGLLAEHQAPAKNQRFRGGFSLGLPGWGEWSDETSSWRSLLHRPVVMAKSLGAHGMLIEFAPAGRSGRSPDGSLAGHWERDASGHRLPFRGRIVDLIGPAFTFDGIDTGDLAEHLGAYELPVRALPGAVHVGAAGASALWRWRRASTGWQSHSTTTPPTGSPPPETVARGGV